MKKIILFGISVLCFAVLANAQGILGGHVTGNIQIDGQFTQKDDKIGAPQVDEKLLSNAFANILYTNNAFTAGMRFESYLDPMLGFDTEYKGFGIPIIFASFKKDKYEFTAGSFYDQYGSGMVFRAYEDKNLGLDNAIRGFNAKFSPIDGIILKGMIGQQRYYWEYQGLVRGVDGDFMLNSIIPGFQDKDLKVILGGSFVSKYEEDQEITTVVGDSVYALNLPLNVGAGGARMNINYKGFGLQAEYVQKGQDPNAINNFIYKKGEALFLSASYSQKGLGINVQAKRIDNMSFKSKRSETGSMLDINYLPSLTKQHTYALLAMYPYATQPNGEMGLQADVVWTIKKGSAVGGKYGTEIGVNYSRTQSIDKQQIDENTPIGTMGTDGYKSDFFKVGKDLYYQDFNISITRRLTKDFKAVLTYANIIYDSISIGYHGKVYTNNLVFEGLYKINSKNVLRGELQWLQTKQDKGDWAALVLEYTFKNQFFINLSDQWNYGNPDSDMKLHYYNIALGYNYGSSRIQLSYGRQKEGILCVGGVCRAVPASNGFMISLTSTF